MTAARALAAVMVTALAGTAACRPGGDPLASRQAALAGAEVSYFHAGTGPGPVLVTDADGQVVSERASEPYGADVAAVDHAAEPLGALGKMIDPSTGLSDHGARWLAPRTGRWLSPDPLVLAPSTRLVLAPWDAHPYQYVRSNPTLFWDPDGRDLRVSGPASAGVIDLLERASGLDLERNWLTGQVRIVGVRPGKFEPLALQVVARAVLSPDVKVHFQTVYDDDRVLVGAYTTTPGKYQIDFRDLKDLYQYVDPEVAKSAIVHELHEAGLHYADPDPAGHDARHTSAIAVENALLLNDGLERQDLGSFPVDAHRNVEIVDYGRFQVQNTRFADGTHGSIQRVDKP